MGVVDGGVRGEVVAAGSPQPGHVPVLVDVELVSPKKRQPGDGPGFAHDRAITVEPHEPERAPLGLLAIRTEGPASSQRRVALTRETSHRSEHTDAAGRAGEHFGRGIAVEDAGQHVGPHRDAGAPRGRSVGFRNADHHFDKRRWITRGAAECRGQQPASEPRSVDRRNHFGREPVAGFGRSRMGCGHRRERVGFLQSHSSVHPESFALLAVVCSGQHDGHTAPTRARP